jgi:hypothetical protein
MGMNPWSKYKHVVHDEHFESTYLLSAHIHITL